MGLSERRAGRLGWHSFCSSRLYGGAARGGRGGGGVRGMEWNGMSSRSFCVFPGGVVFSVYAV